jgi:hypothetical protein
VRYRDEFDQEARKILAQVAELAGVTGIAQENLMEEIYLESLTATAVISIRGITMKPATAHYRLIPRYAVAMQRRKYQGRNFQKREPLLKATRAVRAAKEAILALDKRDQAELRRVLICEVPFPAAPGFHRMYAERLVKEAWNHWPDRLLIALSEWTGSNPFTAPSKGRKGRRDGAVGHWHLQRFVERLWVMANTHGGNFYADHKRPDGGTMIKALRLLAPILPTGFIPNELPVSTIETTIKNFKASGRRLRRPT